MDFIFKPRNNFSFLGNDAIFFIFFEFRVSFKRINKIDFFNIGNDVLLLLFKVHLKNNCNNFITYKIIIIIILIAFI